MKIEIDLKDILGDEYGSMESLASSIERQLVDYLKVNLSGTILAKIDSLVSKTIADKVKKTADEVIPSFMKELVDHEYFPVDRYGSVQSPTTMRKELLKTLTDQMVYKKTSYDSDKNYFTRNIDTLLSEEMAKFKKSYNSKVDEVFTKEAFEYAIIKMQQKFKMGQDKI